MKSIKYILYTLTILIFSTESLVVNAQLSPSATSGTAASSANTNAASSRLPYNPSSGTNGSKTFSGTTFAGAGGAIAGCANVGGLVVTGVSSLFKKTGNSVSNSLNQAVKVEDTQTQKELKRTNRTLECLNGVAYAISKNLLQQVSDKTLRWINKGLGGNPLYVQDINSNLRSIRDEKLQNYLDSVQNSNPIFGNAIRSAITKQVTGITDGYIDKAMDTPEAKEYQKFQENFTYGGWDSLLNMNNNPVGVLFNNTDRIASSIAVEQKNRFDEIQRNGGFLDMKECVEYAPVLDLETENKMRARFGYPAQKEVAKPNCIRYRTVTPGSLIAEQASTILNSPTRQLEVADGINEVLGAFFDQILNKLFQNGLAGLQGSNRSGLNFGNTRSSGSNVVLGSNGLPISSSGGADAIGYQSISGGYNVQDFDISRPQQLRAISQAQHDFLNRSKDSQLIMRSIVPTLGALDYCIPGPNPTWRDGLDNNFQSFISSLETPVKGGSAFAKILGSLLGNLLGGLFGNDKEIQYALAGKPALFDKASNSQIEISPWSYLYYTKDYDRGVKNTDGDWIRNFISSGYTRVIEKYEKNLTDTAIIDLFTATDPNTNYAKGAIKESLKETSKLMVYNENITPLDDSYSQAISDKEDTIAELESIRLEALEIVKIAKARYIAEQATAGTPVNIACLDQAYVINQNPIVGVPRQETGATDPIIQKSKDAKDYFYSKI
jgi:hypothetical protein